MLVNLGQTEVGMPPRKGEIRVIIGDAAPGRGRVVGCKAMMRLIT
jgi:hypothetical protein